MALNLLWRKKLISSGILLNTTSSDYAAVLGFMNVIGCSRITVEAYFDNGSSGGVVTIEACPDSNPDGTIPPVAPANPKVLGTLVWAADDSVQDASYALESHAWVRPRISTPIAGGGDVTVWMSAFQ